MYGGFCRKRSRMEARGRWASRRPRWKLRTSRNDGLVPFGVTDLWLLRSSAQ
ncbi:hypothetical protein BD311DRAFT_769911 [Dichomitus squalens]|uniref:Uncharacterized protein n=1 Tax=Dichomitus squalens TaxID=114155 RepID=A0A4Q9M966_9APHY|nr:hypothetical protein BD311DRAFT_769911 [Dichomitus squalens]